MKKALFFIFIVNSLILHSATFTLKDKAVINDNFVKFNEIFIEKESGYNNIILLKDINSSRKLDSLEILKNLFKNNIYDAVIIGDEIFIEKNNSAFSENKNAYWELKKFLLSNIYCSNISLELEVEKTLSEISIKDIKENFSWNYPVIKDILKEYKKLKKFEIQYKGITYQIDANISLYADIFIAKESILKDELLDINKFINYKKELSTITNFENLSLDINKKNNYRFTKNMQAGEILYNNYFKKVPLILKNEEIKAVFNKNSFEITVQSISLQDGFENEKIKIRLFNNKEAYGVLKVINGEKHVEI